MTPNDFENKHSKSSVLIIGTGHSTKTLVPYKHSLRDKFDIIIGLNFATKDFEKQMHYHVILEKNPVVIYEDMKKRSYRKDLVRILNKKSIHRFPQDIIAVPAGRNHFNGNPNIRKYKHKGEEGLLIGPKGNKGLSVGSVTLNALHFAAILGASNIYLMGADLIFRDEYDHYYPDHHYRKSKTKLANRSPIVDIDLAGKTYKTTRFFQESAVYIDKVIDTFCAEAGIAVYDFSNGLISNAIKLDLDEFMREDIR